MKTKVAIVKCKDYKRTEVEQAVNKAFDLLGGINALIKKGERVLFGKYSGDDLVIDGVKHKIVKESEILAVYETK